MPLLQPASFSVVFVASSCLLQPCVCLQASFYLYNVDPANSTSSISAMLQAMMTAQHLSPHEQRMISMEILVSCLAESMWQLAGGFIAQNQHVFAIADDSHQVWTWTVWLMFQQSFPDPMLSSSLNFLQQRFQRNGNGKFWRDTLTEVAPDADAASYFQLAVQAGNQQLCRIMVECGALPWQPVSEDRSGAGKLPITLALEANDLPMAQLLLKLTSSDDFEQTWACLLKSSTQVLAALFKSSARPELAELVDLLSQLGRLGFTPAAKAGKRGAHQQQQTALMLACMHGYAAGVEALSGECVLQSLKQVLHAGSDIIRLQAGHGICSSALWYLHPRIAPRSILVWIREAMHTALPALHCKLLSALWSIDTQRSRAHKF
ncbi:hypothetical protein MMC07_000383 [Pseudocyphellaria aurata]|nr:hypothetical protein [Pseudocyphellaria aurata]